MNVNNQLSLHERLDNLENEFKTRFDSLECNLLKILNKINNRND